MRAAVVSEQMGPPLDEGIRKFARVSPAASPPTSKRAVSRPGAITSSPSPTPAGEGK